MAKYTYTTPDPATLTGSFRKSLNNDFTQSKSIVSLGNGVLLDIEKCPHILIAGTTGSGKSVMIHSIIASLMLKNTPADAQLLLIDPKRVELKYFYDNCPMVWNRKVITEPEEAYNTLLSAKDEMMKRYDIMSNTGERFWTGQKLYIVIDEVADLLDAAGKKLETVISSIARLGRGAGVHLIIATQHPTARVLSRQITANLDTRIALRVEDRNASRLIINAPGAETLKGKGDALLRHNGNLIHFHGGYISDTELNAFCKSYKLEKKSFFKSIFSK